MLFPSRTKNEEDDAGPGPRIHHHDDDSAILGLLEWTAWLASLVLIGSSIDEQDEVPHILFIKEKKSYEWDDEVIPVRRGGDCLS